jgi:hypothetical protein
VETVGERGDDGMKRLLVILIILGQPLIARAGSGDTLADWFIIPVVAHAPGSAGTYWKSDLSIVNPYNWQEIRVYLQVMVSDQPNSNLPEKSVIIPAGGSVYLEDVLDSVFNLTGTAAMIVRTKDTRKFTVTARTYTGADGSYGQTENGQMAMNRGQEVAFITGVKSSASFRSNVGIVNASFFSANFKVYIYSSDGLLMGQETVTVDKWSHTQRSVRSIADRFDHGYVKIWCQAPASQSIEWIAYVSVVDQTSGDAVFLEERTDRQFTQYSPSLNLNGWWTGSIDDGNSSYLCRVYIEQDGPSVHAYVFNNDWYLENAMWGYENQGVFTVVGGESWYGECLEEYTAWGNSIASQSRIFGSYNANGSCISGKVTFDITRTHKIDRDPPAVPTTHR